MSSITTPTVQSSPETGTTNIVEPEVQPELETSQENETTESIATQTTSTPFQGDGTDPSQAALLIPQRTLTEWLTYSISLNYNRLATSVLSPITHWQWYNRIPHTNVILGAVPSQQILVQLQREQRLENVVNMCAEFNGHIETMNDLGLVQCWIPTRDFQTPSLDSIWTGVRFMSKCGTRWQGLEESKRGTLYIHCKDF
ncbi:hypothetical protein BGZ46_007631 [Entomortierella lignicola]|nr:hypothetical protein BGZ46_007631 [Entomortierella lignicola]